MPAGLEPPPRASTDSSANATVQPRPCPSKISQARAKPGSRPALCPSQQPSPTRRNWRSPDHPANRRSAASPSSLPSDPTAAPDSPRPRTVIRTATRAIRPRAAPSAPPRARLLQRADPGRHRSNGRSQATPRRTDAGGSRSTFLRETIQRGRTVLRGLAAREPSAGQSHRTTGLIAAWWVSRHG